MFDLCGPMKGCASTHGRHLFMEGDLKYKDNINKVSIFRNVPDNCLVIGVFTRMMDAKFYRIKTHSTYT